MSAICLPSLRCMASTRGDTSSTALLKHAAYAFSASKVATPSWIKSLLADWHSCCRCWNRPWGVFNRGSTCELRDQILSLSLSLPHTQEQALYIDILAVELQQLANVLNRCHAALHALVCVLGWACAVGKTVGGTHVGSHLGASQQQKCACVRTSKDEQQLQVR